MTRIVTRIFAGLIVALAALPLQAQTVRLVEVDGSPSVDAWKIILPNDTLSRNGSIATFDLSSLGGGDMSTGTYDTTGDGIIDVGALPTTIIYTDADAGLGSLAITSDSDGTVLAVRRLSAGQTNNPFEVQTEANAMVFAVGPTGSISANNITTRGQTVFLNTDGDRFVKMGTGSPEAAVTGSIGSIWIASDGTTGTTLWVKESGTGNTGWRAIAEGGGGGTPDDGSVTTAKFDASTLVTEADTIASNDNDTTVPTSAAVKAYADSLIAGGFDATAQDALTWSDGANASNAWTFNLSGTDPVFTAVSGGFSITGTLATSGTINGASATEMGYLSGVTSAIQTQLNAKGNLSGGNTWSGNQSGMTLVAPALGTPASGNFGSGTFTWPTFNQNTTGSAATLTTARNLWGQSFNGSAAIGGNIELGTAGTTDTTLSRVSAGVAAIEGANILVSGGDAGTPSAIDLTNATNVPEDTSKAPTASPTFTGTVTVADGFAVSGATVTITEASPDTGTIAVTELLNVATIDEATTFSFSATPSTGVRFGLRVTNSTGSDVVATFPSSYSEAAGANRTTMTVPANGTVTVLWERLASSYIMYGDYLPLTKFIGSRATPDTTAGAITISDSVNGLVVFANTTTEYDLEAAANWKGKTLLVHNCGTNTITIDPNGTEVIYLAGAALSGGDRITISNTAGSYVALLSDGVSITVWGYLGTITDAN